MMVSRQATDGPFTGAEAIGLGVPPRSAKTDVHVLSIHDLSTRPADRCLQPRARLRSRSSRPSRRR